MTGALISRHEFLVIDDGIREERIRHQPLAVSVFRFAVTVQDYEVPASVEPPDPGTDRPARIDFEFQVFEIEPAGVNLDLGPDRLESRFQPLRRVTRIRVITTVLAQQASRPLTLGHARLSREITVDAGGNRGPAPFPLLLRFKFESLRHPGFLRCRNVSHQVVGASGLSFGRAFPLTMIGPNMMIGAVSGPPPPTSDLSEVPPPTSDLSEVPPPTSDLSDVPPPGPESSDAACAAI